MKKTAILLSALFVLSVPAFAQWQGPSPILAALGQRHAEQASKKTTKNIQKKILVSWARDFVEKENKIPQVSTPQVEELSATMRSQERYKLLLEAKKGHQLFKNYSLVVLAPNGAFLENLSKTEWLFLMSFLKQSVQQDKFNKTLAPVFISAGKEAYLAWQNATPGANYQIRINYESRTLFLESKDGLYD